MHKTCNVNFRTGKCIPALIVAKSSERKRGVGRPPKDLITQKVGRPVNTELKVAFKRVAEQMDWHDQYVISDLVEEMRDELSKFNSDLQPYSIKHMTNKLKEHFADQVFITNIKGKKSVLTFVDLQSNDPS